MDSSVLIGLRYPVLPSGELSRNPRSPAWSCAGGSPEQSDQHGEEAVEFAADVGDPLIVVAREQQAGLVDGELGVAVGVGVEQGPQRCVQHGRWVVAEHALGDRVIAHQILGGFPQ
jgi:hypothetical protein